MEILIRQAQEFDFAAIVDLNDAAVQHTSPMDLNRLSCLDQLSTYHMVAEVEHGIAAFLLAIEENRPYQNRNYEWFSSRYPKFLYVDRIVVDGKYAGLKIGSMLYQNLIDHAHQTRIPLITCEYNITPPNEPSRVFHEKFGFTEVGTQWLDNGAKQVSLQAAKIEQFTNL